MFNQLQFAQKRTSKYRIDCIRSEVQNAIFACIKLCTESGWIFDYKIDKLIKLKSMLSAWTMANFSLRKFKWAFDGHANNSDHHWFINEQTQRVLINFYCTNHQYHGNIYKMNTTIYCPLIDGKCNKVHRHACLYDVYVYVYASMSGQWHDVVYICLHRTQIIPTFDFERQQIYIYSYNIKTHSLRI